MVKIVFKTFSLTKSLLILVIILLFLNFITKLKRKKQANKNLTTEIDSQPNYGRFKEQFYYKKRNKKLHNKKSLFEKFFNSKVKKDYLVDVRSAGLGLSHFQYEEIYEKYADSVEVECDNWRRLGNEEEGGWNFCLDGNLSPKKFLSSQNSSPSSPLSCLVYSFGIGNDWSFDEAVERDLGCLVRSFDPSINSSSIHGRNIFFSKFGLAGSNRNGNTNQWKLRTLKSIEDMFNETEREISYLKIDIEYWEWEALRKAAEEGALKNVKQLGLEVHRDELMQQQTPDSHYLQFFKVFYLLRQQGFYKWHSQPNPLSINFYSSRSKKIIKCCHEFVYINLNFL